MSIYLLIVLLSCFTIGSNDAIAPDFPAEVLGTRDDDLSIPANTKHKEGIYSKRVVSKPSSTVGKKNPQKDNTGNWISFFYFVAFFWSSKMRILSSLYLISGVMQTFLLVMLLGIYKKLKYL